MGGASSLGAMARVLVIEGSEGASTTHVAKRMVQDWLSSSDIQFKLDPNVLSGNAAAKHFHKLSSDYDVLLVLTSSFGDGDPPSNFEKLMYELTVASDAHEKPLAGMQHAVLGYGDSSYTTFQNNPRMVDK